ncbi:hypothetical protein BC938DRAFT_475431 [Jimgerdemannia flammicorona]|uniref:Uncharacterized protein n=1 Tax=Jimgerdemannia flammicorona TaxID=994334 RepID=A0A433PUV0_9FUNG|nr:hypothetical protein BC938DRAFT_475431 [Jimgerdemannia flammicorona]
MMGQSDHNILKFRRSIVTTPPAIEQNESLLHQAAMKVRAVAIGFKIIGGRRFMSKTNTKYILPKDDEETDRLETNHRLFRARSSNKTLNYI